jgi:hypothetical protein
VIRAVTHGNAAVSITIRQSVILARLTSAADMVIKDLAGAVRAIITVAINLYGAGAIS